ncbi:MAG: hypothetical protein ABI831_05790 [Betaproteobacteria bacterium]
MAKSFFGLFQTAVEEEPLSSVKSVQAWAARLPANDPMGTVRAMIHLLEDISTRQPAMTPNRVQALVAFDSLSLGPLGQLQVQYRLPTLSDDVRQQLWYARNDLARWFAFAYEQVYEGVRNQPDRQKYQALLPGVFSRMFYYRGVQAKQGLFRYEQWIPAKWKFLHAAYGQALELGVATEGFSLVDNGPPGDRRSAEQEYIHFLLMQRVNTGNLSVLQIDTAATWLRDWVPVLQLMQAPRDGDQQWMLDLSHSEGLLPCAATVAAGRLLLYLDVAPLRGQLTELGTRLTELLAKGGTKGEVRDLKERLVLVRRLELLWLPNAGIQQRRSERQLDQQPVLVAAGWSEIAIFMRETRPWKPHDPYRYTYDDAADLVALGRTPPPKTDKPEGGKNLHPDRRGWQIHDTSETGCRIVSTTRQAAQIQLGALVTILRETDTRWRVAIVRRLKRRTAEHTELGLEIIADNSILVMPEPVLTTANKDALGRTIEGKRFDALYLPPTQSTTMAPVYSLVLPVSEYVAGRLLAMTLEGQPRVIRLAVAIEHHKDWVWSTFEAAAPAARDQDQVDQVA